MPEDPQKYNPPPCDKTADEIEDPADICSISLSGCFLLFMGSGICCSLEHMISETKTKGGTVRHSDHYEIIIHDSRLTIHEQLSKRIRTTSHNGKFPITRHTIAFISLRERSSWNIIVIIYSRAKFAQLELGRIFPGKCNIYERKSRSTA